MLKVWRALYICAEILLIGHVVIHIRRDFFDRILCTGIILDIIGEYTEHIWMLFVKDNGNIVFDNTEFSGVCKFSGFCWQLRCRKEHLPESWLSLSGS